MATGNRTLKLSILADVDDLKKKLGEADKAVETNANKISDFGKKAAVAFAVAATAAAAYATKLAVDGVKAAIEDEAAQLRLASALKTATGATDDQIKATEDYISKTQLATGVADNDLRNAFQRLAVSTKDVSSSQSLLNLALDVSKGTGKDLATITEALAKAYEGNDAKLAKLGIGLSATDLKAMDFTQTQVALSNLYGGAASKNAETFQGRIDRLKQGFEEAKESVGAALLPIIERLIGYIFTYGEPIIEKFKEAWEKIKKAIDDNKESFDTFGKFIKDTILPLLGTVFGFLVDVGGKAAAFIINTFGKIIGIITPIVNFVIDGINAVIKAINAVTGSNIGLIPGFGGGGGGGYRSGERGDPTPSPGAGTTPTVPPFQPVTGGAGNGSVAAPVFPPALGPIGGVDYTVPIGTGKGGMPGGSYTTYNINVSGAIDPVSTARQVANLINNETSTSGRFGSLGEVGSYR